MSARDPHAPVLIAGGGIGGLAAANALAHTGVRSLVLERSETFSEAGAGIQLGPNTMRALTALGVMPHLEDQLVRPEGIRIFDGPSGRELTTVPLGETARARYGAPYGLLHRADLQAGLFAAAREQPDITITTGFELNRYSAGGDGVRVYSTLDEALHGSALIAADGISSRVRAQLAPSARLSFAGRTAWRTLIPIADAPEAMSRDLVTLWMAPGAHLIHYPVRGGAMMNIVAVIEDAWDKEGWNTAADRDELLPCFADWCAPARAIVEAGESWRKWALFTLPPLRRWHAGPVVLLGDAAHPVLPFLAQGAGLAIEDAFVLARELAEANGNPEAAFARFEAKRRRRARRVQTVSGRMGEVYHFGGLGRRARNTAIAALGPQRHLKRFDWLYRFDVTMP